MSNFLFIHHQKTAGRSLIKEVQASNQYAVYTGSNAFENIDLVNASDNVFIGNHYPYSQRELFTATFTPITILREPAKRLRSYWNHIQSDINPDPWKPSDFHSSISAETDITAILADPTFAAAQVNGMTRRLIQSFAVNHSDYKDISLVAATTAEHLAAAKEVLDQCIVGIFEDYDASRDYICEQLGITTIQDFMITDVDQGTNPFDGAETQVNEANNLDYELWEYGKTLLANQLAN